MTIDLRSDTVTTPTPAMREAMVAAPVGDDVYGEDPTINELQCKVAELLGKEAGLFVPSGTLGNQLCIKVLTNPGDEILVDEESHVFHYENAAPAVISGVQLNCFPSENGIPNSQTMKEKLRPTTYYYPQTRLLCLENTHNRRGGLILELDEMWRCVKEARNLGLTVHCDGARLWNACAATGIKPQQYAEPFDTLSVCLSKGLGAPVGSVIVGTKSSIERARVWRKLLGAGMRQAGILAAAGLYALEYHLPLLQKDHSHARHFANILYDSGFFTLKPDKVQTNIVMFEGKEELHLSLLVEECRKDGVLFAMMTQKIARVVFHHQISSGMVHELAEIILHHSKILIERCGS